jgi:hypothetical protein
MRSTADRPALSDAKKPAPSSTTRCRKFAEERWPLSPALRPVRAIMEKVDPKPEPQPLPAHGKRASRAGSWRGSDGVDPATKRLTTVRHLS